jgi:hypothetical protein
VNTIRAIDGSTPRTDRDPDFQDWLLQQEPNTRALMVHISGAEAAVAPQTDALTDAELRATPVRTAASPESSTIYSGTTALTPKFAVIDHAVSGDNTLVAAVANRKIRVLSLMMIAAGSVNARFESGAGVTALSGQMQLTAQSGFTLPFNPAGWFETTSGALLNLELSAAISVDGMLTYVEVP